MNTLKAGFARVDITPPLGIHIQGYFVERIADGVLDPLSANALALSAGGKTAVDALLAEVKPGYATDALKATQIAVLTQRVMAKFPQPWWKFWASEDHAARRLWTSRLQAFAAESKSVDVKLFFLDQLRWCGYPGQAKAVRALKGSKEVTDFADMVATELEGR